MGGWAHQLRAENWV